MFRLGLIHGTKSFQGANPGSVKLVMSFVDVSSGGHLERVGKYPKDGDLCVARAKPEETLVEARSDSDVQIDRLSCV